MADHYDEFQARNTEIVSIVPEPPDQVQDWQDSYGLPFPLCAYPDKRVSEGYDQPVRFGVLGSRTVDGRTIHRLTVENGSGTLGGLRNVSMNATVREDGLVTAYRLSYDVGDLRVAVAVEFRRVGETEITPPAWLPAARNATGVGTPAPVRTGGATATGTEREVRQPTERIHAATGRPVAGRTLRPATLLTVSSPFPRAPGASGAVSSRSSSAGVRP